MGNPWLPTPRQIEKIQIIELSFFSGSKKTSDINKKCSVAYTVWEVQSSRGIVQSDVCRKVGNPWSLVKHDNLGDVQPVNRGPLYYICYVCMGGSCVVCILKSV